MQTNSAPQPRFCCWAWRPALFMGVPVVCARAPRRWSSTRRWIREFSEPILPRLRGPRAAVTVLVKYDIESTKTGGARHGPHAGTKQAPL